MPENFRRVLTEVPVEGKPLGRHVNHDPRSLSYLVKADGTVKSARWARITPVLDQGSVGSCTGNAACGALGTEVFYATLADKIAAGLELDENEALSLYSAATKLDSYRGTYPPTDTGSDGLSVAKAAKAAGLISGYRHITSLSAAKTAIQSGPFIVGTGWYEGMDEPDATGVVQATGQLRGGHEYECIGYDVDKDLWEFVNSWGTGFGVDGHFFYSSATFSTLLKDHGDATVFVPLTWPAPTPTPPAPAPTPNEDLKAWLRSVVAWIEEHLPNL